MISEILKGCTVLLVDDEKYSQQVFGTALKGMGEPRLLIADNGDEAMDYLSDDLYTIDLIVSDFNMPFVHGLQLLKAVRCGVNNINRATPFAMLTGYSDERLVDFALALDVNAFLIKPASKEALAKRLRKLMLPGKSEQWLKQVKTYDAIDVDGALKAIAKPDVEPKGARGIQLMPRNKALFRRAGPKGVDVRGAPSKLEKTIGVDVRGLPKTPDRDEPPAQRRQYEGILCPIGDLPEGAILARDVYTAHGVLFMHAGTELTPRIVSILTDLHDLDHPVKELWIATEEEMSSSDDQ